MLDLLRNGRKVCNLRFQFTPAKHSSEAEAAIIANEVLLRNLVFHPINHLWQTRKHAAPCTISNWLASEQRLSIYRLQQLYSVVKQSNMPGMLQVLTQELGGLVNGLTFKRSMRWDSSATFSRPVRWLLGLHGDTILPFSFGGLQAGAASRALRSDGPLQVGSADEYLCVVLPHPFWI